MLRVEDLRVSFGSRPVLRGVNLQLERGEVVALVGPNGSGKTTLLKAITRLVALQAGRVLIDGADASQMSARQLARAVAVVSQNPRLPAGYSVRDVGLIGRTAHLAFLQQEGTQDLRKVDEALGQVDALPLADRLVDELSGGERQKVIIARALAQEAPLLLLDEPSANLDLGHQIAVARLIRRLAHEEGFAVLAAIHDLPLAALYADRMVLLREGVIIASGAPAEVLTRENVIAAYGVDAALVSIEGLTGPIVLPFIPAEAGGMQAPSS
jgi:iron complex transport system ATP-binding protein